MRRKEEYDTRDLMILDEGGGTLMRLFNKLEMKKDESGIALFLDLSEAMSRLRLYLLERIAAEVKANDARLLERREKLRPTEQPSAIADPIIIEGERPDTKI